MDLINYIISLWLAPWALGTVISLACLKRRYGYFAFALGSGYLVGLLITLGVQKVSGFYQVQPNTLYVLLGQLALIFLIAFFRPAKPCTIEEQRLEKAPSNFAYFTSLVVVILLTARLFLIYSSSFELPLNPSTQQIISADVTVSLLPPTWGLQFTDWMQLQQSTGLALTESYQYLKSLPCLAVAIAMSLVIFGGLRYLGCKLLPSVLAVYMAMSLPAFSEYLEQKAMLLIIMSAYYLLFMMSSAMMIGRAEKRLLPLIVLLLLALSTHHYLLLVGVVGLALLIVWRYLGVLAALLSLCVLVTLGYWQVAQTSTLMNDIQVMPRQFFVMLYETVIVGDSWHLLGISLLVSLLLLLVVKRRYDYHSLSLFIVAVLTALLSALGLLFYGQQKGIADVTYIGHSLMLFAPLLCLLPVTVYHLVTLDKDSIPTI